MGTPMVNGEMLERAALTIERSRALVPQTQRTIARARAIREATAHRREGRAPGDPVAERTAARPVNGAPPLTPRQHEILRLIDSGLGTKEIARELWLSPATVRNHAAAVMAALGVHSRLQAIARARSLGLLD
jgi:DNA-binding NarL/FixJ family response regulator